MSAWRYSNTRAQATVPLLRRNARWLRRAGTLVVGVVRLATTWRAKAEGARTALVLLLRSRLGRHYARHYELRLRVLGHPMRLNVSSVSDLEVIHEIVVKREYDIAGLPPPRTMLDLGSHIGLSAIWFRLRFPGVRIFAVEPDPGNFEKLLVNVGAFSDVEVRACAVTPFDEPQAPFFRAREGWASSLRPPPDEAVRVPGRSLDSLLEDFGLGAIDLLKIDIEGAEFAVFESFHGLDRVNAIVGELHDDPSSQRVTGVFDRLSDFDIQIHEERRRQVVFSAVRRKPPAITGSKRSVATTAAARGLAPPPYEEDIAQAIERAE